jgi:hypothetical protein
MMMMDAIKSILATTTTEAPVAAVVGRRIVALSLPLPQVLVVVPCSKLIITHLQEGKASNPPSLPLLLLLRSFILRIAFHPVIQITTTIRPTTPTTSQRLLMVDLRQLPDHCSHHLHLLLLYPSQQISSCLITSRLYRRHHHPSLRTIMNEPPPVAVVVG